MADQVLVFSGNYKSGPSSFKIYKNGPCINQIAKWSLGYSYLARKDFGQLTTSVLQENRNCNYGPCDNITPNGPFYYYKSNPKQTQPTQSHPDPIPKPKPPQAQPPFQTNTPSGQRKSNNHPCTLFLPHLPLQHITSPPHHLSHIPPPLPLLTYHHLTFNSTTPPLACKTEQFAIIFSRQNTWRAMTKFQTSKGCGISSERSKEP